MPKGLGVLMTCSIVLFAKYWLKSLSTEVWSLLAIASCKANGLGWVLDEAVLDDGVGCIVCSFFECKLKGVIIRKEGQDQPLFFFLGCLRLAG